uniref:hypothetical protein n=1 Tax=Streptomyces sp. SID8382 TaxID=2690362 RepID=UPI001E3A640B|nr:MULTISPECIES: hypothetical protein [unclassified Streptomyces]
MALFQGRETGKPGEWFHCLTHDRVEDGPECRAADRFGPYGSREGAGQAMEIHRERNEQRTGDPRWRDEDYLLVFAQLRRRSLGCRQKGHRHLRCESH